MKTPSSPPPSYEQCTRLAEAGEYDEALAGLRTYLEHHPDDGPALNDAGSLLWALGRFDEAVEYLRRAVDRLDGNKGQALWNLVEVYLASGRPAEAVALFDELACESLLTAELANRAATLCLDSGDTAGAVEAMIRSLRAHPDQEILNLACQVIRSKRPKVAFFSEFDDTKFIGDIFEFVSDRFEARLAKGQTPQQTADLLKWCDIAWFEWCTDQVVMASKLPKTFRSIVRLHRFEAYYPWPENVRWENIDVLVTVGNPAVVEHLKQTVPDIEQRTRLVTVLNAVDLERYAFINRPRGKNIACLGYINLRKNPALLLQCFAKLHSIDPEYRLFFAGTAQDPMLVQYVENMIAEMGLVDSVFIEGWQDDVAAWLDDKHYLVSTSLGEGLPVSVLEGMARGLKPVIHTWPGVRDIFPDEWLFRTVDEFCERVFSDPYEPRAYREFVAERHSLKPQLEQVNALLLEFEKNPCPKPKPPETDAGEDATGATVDAFLDEVTASSRQGA